MKNASLSKTVRSFLSTALLIVVLSLTGVWSCSTVIDAGKPPASASFMKVIGGSGDETSSTVMTLSDGGYAVFGTTTSYGSGGQDFYLVRTDANGNEVWHVTFGGVLDDIGSACRQTSDGGFVMVGSTLNNTNGSNDVLVVKCDSTGKQLWSKTFGGTSYDDARGVRQTTDGGYVICGTTYVGSSYDFYLIKLDAAGNEQWEKSYGQSFTDACSDVEQSAGGYIMIGGRPNPDYIELWKAASDGKDLGLSNTLLNFYGTAYAMSTLPNGNYCVFGSKLNIGTATDTQAFVFSLNDSLRLPWSTAIGSGGNYRLIGGMAANGVIAGVGYTDNTSKRNLDVYFVALDLNGNVLWSHIYGGTENDVGSDVAQAKDGGYVIVGTTRSVAGGINGKDILLIKTDASGNVTN